MLQQLLRCSSCNVRERSHHARYSAAMRDEARCGASAATYSSRYASTCEHTCSADSNVAKAILASNDSSGQDVYRRVLEGEGVVLEGVLFGCAEESKALSQPCRN